MITCPERRTEGYIVCIQQELEQCYNESLKRINEMNNSEFVDEMSTTTRDSFGWKVGETQRWVSYSAMVLSPILNCEQQKVPVLFCSSFKIKLSSRAPAMGNPSGMHDVSCVPCV